MSNPLPTTVRGWLAAIFNVLSANTQQDLVAELRLLNRRLWGADAAGGVYNGIPLWNSLTVQDQDFSDFENGYPVRRLELGAWLRENLRSTGFYGLGQNIDIIRLTAGGINGSLNTDLFGVNNQSAAQLLKLILDAQSGGGPTPTGGATEETLAALLAAVGALNTNPGGFSARNLLGRIALATERAADCCENVPPSGTFPPAPAVGCTDYGVYLGYGDALLPNGPASAVVSWSDQGAGDFWQVVTVGGESMFRLTGTARTLCFVRVYRDDTPAPDTGVSGLFTSWNIASELPSDSPSLSWNGNNDSTVGPFAPLDPIDGDPQAYRLSVSIGPNDTGGQYLRIYVFAQELS